MKIKVFAPLFLPQKNHSPFIFFQIQPLIHFWKPIYDLLYVSYANKHTSVTWLNIDILNITFWPSKCFLEILNLEFYLFFIKKKSSPPFFEKKCSHPFFSKKILRPLIFFKKKSPPLSLVPAGVPHKFWPIPSWI